MNVKIELMETSQAIYHREIVNTYTKGILYCVMLKDCSVYKYPIDHIFRSYEYEAEEPE